MNQGKINIIVPDEFDGARLDKVIAEMEKEISRTHALKLIEEGNVTIDGKVVNKASIKIKSGTEIIVSLPEPEPTDIEAEDIPLDIVYEDDDILVVNKPQGMVVHPAHGHYQGTLVNALLSHCTNLSGINGEERPGIVHRIDKDTSGLLVVSKNDVSHMFLAEQLKDHSMHREYYALVKGMIKEESGKVDLPIGRSRQNRQKMAIDPVNGKRAVTYFEVVTRYCDYTLIKCRLETGRTHQIRVHMAYIGHPVEGDPIYGSGRSKLYKEGQLLHAYRLTLMHPTLKKEMSFTCPLPKYFKDILDNLH